MVKRSIHNNCNMKIKFYIYLIMLKHIDRKVIKVLEIKKTLLNFREQGKILEVITSLKHNDILHPIFLSKVKAG